MRSLFQQILHKFHTHYDLPSISRSIRDEGRYTAHFSSNYSFRVGSMDRGRTSVWLRALVPSLIYMHVRVTYKEKKLVCLKVLHKILN